MGCTSGWGLYKLFNRKTVAATRPSRTVKSSVTRRSEKVADMILSGCKDSESTLTASFNSLPNLHIDMSSHDDIAAILRALQTPICELQDLLPLLIAPLKTIALLPPGYDNHNVKLLNPFINIPIHIPLIQHALIEKVVPTWEFALRESGNLQLLEQYFCPVRVNENVPAATEVITLAYSTIISNPLIDFSVHLLQRLSADYPMVKIYKMIFQRFSMKQEVIWEDYVRIYLSIPTRIANSVGVRGYIPPSLESASYLQSICIQCEQLITYASSQDMNGMLMIPSPSLS